MGRRGFNVLARFLMVVYIITLAYLCFASAENLPASPRFFNFPNSDKVIHYLMFLPFAWLSLFCMGRGPHRPSWQVVVSIMCFGVIIAGTTELIQNLLPCRACDFLDFGADLLSIVLNSLLLRVLPR